VLRNRWASCNIKQLYHRLAMASHHESARNPAAKLAASLHPIDTIKVNTVCPIYPHPLDIDLGKPAPQKLRRDDCRKLYHPYWETGSEKLWNSAARISS